MSYRGYERVLCKNGHLHIYDCWDAPNIEEYKCFDCGEGCAWSESVDQTNDAGDETLLAENGPAIMETCACCGHTKQLSPKTYVIPTKACITLGE